MPIGEIGLEDADLEPFWLYLWLGQSSRGSSVSASATGPGVPGLRQGITLSSLMAYRGPNLELDISYK